MSCPRCRENTLQPISTHGATGWSCTSCEGVWIDHASATRIAHAAIDGATTAPSEQLACPVCHTTMGAWTARGIVIDRCDTHGLWFDHEELDRIVEARAAKAKDSSSSSSSSGLIEGIGEAVVAIFDFFT